MRVLRRLFFLALVAVIAPAAAMRLVNELSALSRPLAFGRPRLVRARATMLDPNSDWFSTTAYAAEDLIARPSPAEAELIEIVKALDVAVRAHKQLKRKLEVRLATARMNNNPSYYLMDGLDH